MGWVSLSLLRELCIHSIQRSLKQILLAAQAQDLGENRHIRWLGAEPGQPSWKEESRSASRLVANRPMMSVFLLSLFSFGVAVYRCWSSIASQN
jgi:hypothetical protein